MKKYLSILVSILLFLIFVPRVSAHEAYVLPQNEFQQGLQTFSSHPFAPLVDSSHFQISAIITLLVMFIFAIVMLWSTTKPAVILDKLIKKTAVVGPIIIRLAVGISFYFSAQGNDFLAPELSLSSLPGGAVIRFALYLLSLMILFGIFTEIAALIGLLLFFYAIFYFGQYMITYTNYFAELLVLIFFGSRFLSIDALFFGKRLWVKAFEQYKFLEIPTVRILYGIALIYAGFSIKFLHQDLSIAVYNQYHLQNFFHADGAFIAAGAGLSEIVIGLFIVLGFAQRLTVLISLVFITLSLLYFKEMLWPHLILYGISFSLLINSADLFTIDRYLIPWERNVLKSILIKKHKRR